MYCEQHGYVGEVLQLLFCGHHICWGCFHADGGSRVHALENWEYDYVCSKCHGTLVNNNKSRLIMYEEFCKAVLQHPKAPRRTVEQFKDECTELQHMLYKGEMSLGELSLPS